MMRRSAVAFVALLAVSFSLATVAAEKKKKGIELPAYESGKAAKLAGGSNDPNRKAFLTKDAPDKVFDFYDQQFKKQGLKKTEAVDDDPSARSRMYSDPKSNDTAMVIVYTIKLVWRNFVDKSQADSDGNLVMVSTQSY